MIGRLIPTPGHYHGTGTCTLGLHSTSLSVSRAHTAEPAMLACLSPPPPAASPLATPTASSSSPAVACASPRAPCFISSPSSSLPLYSPYSPYPPYSSYSSYSSSSSSFPPSCASLSSPPPHPCPATPACSAASSMSSSRSACGAVSLSGQLSGRSSSSSTGSLNGCRSGSGSWSYHNRGPAAGGGRRDSGGVRDWRRGLPAGSASATALVSADVGGGVGGGGGGGEGAGGRLKGGAAAAAVGGNGIGGSWAWRGGGGEMSGEGAEARGGAADGGVVGLLQQLPLRRCLVWALVAGLVIQLREFLGIMMGTYVLSVVANAAVEGAQRVLPAKRRLLVALLYAFALAALLALGFAYLPPLYNTATQLILNIQVGGSVCCGAVRCDGPFIPSYFQPPSPSPKPPAAPPPTTFRPPHVCGGQLERYMLLMMSPPTTQGIMGAGGVAMAAHPSAALRQVFKKYAGSMLSLLATAFAATGRFLLKSLVSLILSAMIVWDLPSLARGMQSLQTSRFAPIYDELAPVVLTFGRIFCRALEAQSLIAVVNTALTFLGMMLLNIHGILVLAAVVFVFSFVPVAGVVISTVPMGLVALSEGGVVKVVLVVLMVVLMHALEAYILNPAIYSGDSSPIFPLPLLLCSHVPVLSCPHPMLPCARALMPPSHAPMRPCSHAPIPCSHAPVLSCPHPMLPCARALMLSYPHTPDATFH
ncbi:unnamed protein product [Closterium sp. NIES-53]